MNRKKRKEAVTAATAAAAAAVVVELTGRELHRAAHNYCWNIQRITTELKKSKVPVRV